MTGEVEVVPIGVTFVVLHAEHETATLIFRKGAVSAFFRAPSRDIK